MPGPIRWRARPKLCSQAVGTVPTHNVFARSFCGVVRTLLQFFVMQVQSFHVNRNNTPRWAISMTAILLHIACASVHPSSTCARCTNIRGRQHSDQGVVIQ